MKHYHMVVLTAIAFLFSTIGIDEISLRKRHQSFIVVISSLVKGKQQLIALLKGRKKSTVKQFLKTIPETIKANVQWVCSDMYKGFINASAEQTAQFAEYAKQRGLTIQVFGTGDNARYFKNWLYSFQEAPILEKTEQVIAFTCDFKIALRLEHSDLDLIADIIEESLDAVLK